MPSGTTGPCGAGSQDGSLAIPMPGEPEAGRTRADRGPPPQTPCRPRLSLPRLPAQVHRLARLQNPHVDESGSCGNGLSEGLARTLEPADGEAAQAPWGEGAPGDG